MKVIGDNMKEHMMNCRVNEYMVRGGEWQDKAVDNEQENYYYYRQLLLQ